MAITFLPSRLSMNSQRFGLSEVKITERRNVPQNAIMILGFPDVGLVGVIAASHLVEELNLTEIAYMDSQLLPPLVVLHDGLPHSSVRIFANGNLLLAISETPIPAEIIYPIVDALIEWGKNKNVKMMVTLSGMPAQDRQEMQELKVFAAASTPEMLKTLEGKNVEILREGYMVGPQAIMLQHTSNSGRPALALMAQCFFNYPDPEAAAAVLKGLETITGVKVNVQRLLEKGEEIRLKVRDIMKRTQQELQRQKKGQEYDVPLYVT